jgi:hypothetical protein
MNRRLGTLVTWVGTFATLPSTACPLEAAIRQGKGRSSMANSSGLLACVFMLGALIAPSVLGQQVSPNFGTTVTSTYSIGPCDAIGLDPAISHGFGGLCDYVSTATIPGDTRVGFPIHLPTGALITSITMYFFDNDDLCSPGVGLWATNTIGGPTGLADLSVPAAFNGGASSNSVDLVPPVQIDNAAYSYAIKAGLCSFSASTRNAIYKFDVNYKLQVSPAPATATFGDVPTSNPQFQFIEALAAAGITAGCGGGNYCPNTPVTRGQMAVFLAKALGLNFPN